MLFIRYASVSALYAQDPLVTWAWQDQDRLQLAPQASLLSQLAEQLPAALKAALLHRVAIILPSEAVSLYLLDLPQVQKKHWLKAVPYALEEKLAEDVEQLHFSLGAIERDKTVKVSVISKHLLQHCLTQLAHYHFYPLYMVSEVALLPKADAIQQIFREGEKAFIRLAPDSVVTLAQEQVAIALHKLMPPSEANILLSQQIEIVSLPDLCNEFIRQISDRSVLNVLQGHFKQRTQKTASISQLSWRSVAILLILALFIKFSLYAGEALYYGHQANALKEQSEALYRNYFPQTKKIHNVKRELKAKLRQANLGNNQTSFLVLLSKVHQPLTDLTRQNAASLDIQSLDYDQAQGQLRIEVYLPDFPALDTLKKAVEQAGLVMVIDAANQDKDRVKARIKLGAA